MDKEQIFGQATVMDNGANFLPVELWRICLGFLGVQDICRFEMVSRCCKRIAGDKDFWKQYYCSAWRKNLHLPFTLPTPEWKAMCLDRRSHNQGHFLSTGFRGKRVRWGGPHVAYTGFEGTEELVYRVRSSIRSEDPLVPLVSASAFRGACTVYYEATIQGGGSVGIAAADDGLHAFVRHRHRYGFLSRSRPVGSLPVSYGFHGGDGRIHFHEGSGGATGSLAFDEPFGAASDATTLVGCGYDAARGLLFFTRNGRLLGVCPRDIRCLGYCAVVSLTHPGGSAAFNFGSAPFAFDLELFCAQRARFLQNCENNENENNDENNDKNNQTESGGRSHSRDYVVVLFKKLPALLLVLGVLVMQYTSLFFVIYNSIAGLL